MWVKICGTTTLEDAVLAADAGADAVGFVFAKSARQVSAEHVATITSQLPIGVEKIGVFTTLDADEIVETAERAGLTGVQLHSTFLPALVQHLKEKTQGKLTVMQVVDIQTGGASWDGDLLDRTLEAMSSGPQVDALLLDTAVSGTSGGTGIAFDWKAVAETVQNRLSRGFKTRVVVAGGLRPENVGEAIARLHPWGVDVVSGVEASKGRKDAMRVRAFVAAARRLK